MRYQLRYVRTLSIEVRDRARQRRVTIADLPGPAQRGLTPEVRCWTGLAGGQRYGGGRARADPLTEFAPLAAFGGLLASDLVEVSHDPEVLDSSGWWAVVISYEGEFTAARFGSVTQRSLPQGAWPGIDPDSWTSSMTRHEYLDAVRTVREAIAAGDVYQANVCRVLTASLPAGASLLGLAGALHDQHPAPHAGTVLLPDHSVAVVSASPELFLRRTGLVLESSPIKGTAKTAAEMLEKDAAENIMIVDLVRNDLGMVCEPGSISVPSLLEFEEHPGLVHLVSTVRGTLLPGLGWADILAATFPPGSVTGAPKSSAVRIIEEIEPVPRGPYCGAVGWVDADAGVAELAVGIRTFWAEGDTLNFGTGAGITWGSDPEQEWDETSLKAERLLAVATQRRIP
jgi:para-aminobenzoate synthetase component 1